MGYVDVQAAALQLPASQRSRLVEALMDSFDGEEDGGRWIDVRTEAAWMDEVRRRCEAVDRGEAMLIDHETVMKKLHARFGGTDREDP
ncbi:MAG TPA: addiction module protein [Longimicrobium sp.]|nr:addiction module protein [Longimicrobium sp.]